MMNNINQQEIIEMLKAQVEMGADEAISDKPANNEAISPPQQIAQPTTEMPQQGGQAAKYAEIKWQAIETLQALRQKCENFNGCELKKTATNIVFADGNPQAEIMIIGEAPGSEEDRQGKPFIGEAGKLLDKMLASIAINRQNSYITNIILWRPPGNRTPTPEEIDMFEPIIKQHIRIIKPKIIATLGGTAAKTLTGNSDGILKQRGRWHDYNNDGEKIPLLPMLHPAYLLRMPQQKKLAWEDLLSIHHKMKNLKK